MVTKADDTLAKLLDMYKIYLDGAVRKKVPITPEQSVFVDSPLYQPMTGAEKAAETVRQKLHPKTTGPYQVLISTADTVPIDDRGITNTVSIDRTKGATSVIFSNRNNETFSKVENEGYTEHTKHHPTIDDTKFDVNQPELIETLPVSPPNAQDQNQTGYDTLKYPRTDDEDTDTRNSYVVYRIVGLDKVDCVTKYGVRWYEYSEDEDTLVPESHLPNNSVNR